MSTIPNGYKQTEVGVIPNDWECDELQKYFSFISYGFTNPMPTVSDGIYMITANDVNDGRIKFETARKTSETAYKYLLSDKSRPKKNDILLTKDGSLGRLALVCDEKICINQSVAVLRPNEKVYPLFLKLLLEDTYYQRTMIDNAGGSTIKHIYISIVNKMKVGIPPTIAEQISIATTLSDANVLITKLEKLIDKKRNIKQGAMQELLRPKDGWEVKKLGEIGECIIGLTYTPENVKDKGILVLRSSNVQNNSLKYDDSVFVDCKIPEKLINQENDILICVRNGSRNLIGKCAMIKGRAIGETFGAFMTIYRSGFNEFVHILFQSEIIKTQIDEHLGATINQITNKSLNSFEIPFPPISEQTRIAKILTDMDADIVQLEKKLDKYKMMKQGMMQNLLTGKIRLT